MIKISLNFVPDGIGWPKDQSHKPCGASHNSRYWNKDVHISVKMWYIVGYGTGALWVCDMVYWQQMRLVSYSWTGNMPKSEPTNHDNVLYDDVIHGITRTQWVIVRRAGLLWLQQDFEWRWSVPLFKCLTVLEFSFILFDLCLLITFFNFIMNYVPIVTFWIFTYHKIWILSIMFCFIWSYWIIYFLACLEVS